MDVPVNQNLKEKAMRLLVTLAALMLFAFSTSAEERRRDGERREGERREEREKRRDGERKEGERKEGDRKDAQVVEGTLAAKGENWIEVKAANSDKTAKFIPEWIGGMPDKGGGFDKEVIEKIAKLKVGSRVLVHWKQDEHLRVINVKALDGGERKEGEGDRKEGEHKERDGDHKHERKDGERREHKER
ncbi:MAG TPA: hypothetical protein VEJ63_21730 [Planctomycetota bacterium]|nr:hypothetical protein [Planctomycetota bacterium]